MCNEWSVKGGVRDMCGHDSGCVRGEREERQVEEKRLGIVYSEKIKIKRQN